MLVHLQNVLTFRANHVCRVNYATNQIDAHRAQINMIHDNVALTVSQSEANKVEEEAKRRLIASKKLSLVVDLDQTIIHATVDPTVAEWQKDPENPNYEAVKDVRKFQLVDDGPGARGCWYYIKLRPGLKEFLENISKVYELHIYTMGTRAYARNIAELIDPDRRIFGDRILSRDESGSLITKNLQRLFPVDTKMVVIIDDRGDVWKWNENLIKVTPYDFFVGIGDINSSFLPKKTKIKFISKTEASAQSGPTQDTASEATPPVPELQADDGSSDSGSPTSVDAPQTPPDVSALEQLVSMGGGDDPEVLQAQAQQQDEVLAAQLQDRPLLQKQMKLDAEEDAMTAKLQENGEADHPPPSHHHHNLLRDDDNELYYLEQSLRQVHTEFFDTYTRQLAAAQGGRLAELRGAQLTNKKKGSASASMDLDLIPDVKSIMPAIKSRVLAGVVIVFTGVVPIGTDIHSSDIAIWARGFGARVEEEVSRRNTTHVVAARNRTAKIRRAVSQGRGKIKVVSTKWLMDCITQWKKIDETPYLLKTDDGEVGKPLPGEDDEILSESEDIESAVDTDVEMTESEGTSTGPGSRGLRINTNYDTDTDEDLEGVLPDEDLDNQSPVGGTNDDWKEMHDELEEFLGDDSDDESDNDSIASLESTRSSKASRKIGSKRGYDGGGPDGSTINGKKRAIAKGSSLSQSQLSDESGLPTPNITAGEEDGDDTTNTDDGWDDFENDLEAELANDG
jgi:RNA polymerase II subunit A-like phosphatase